MYLIVTPCNLLYQNVTFLYFKNTIIIPYNKNRNKIETNILYIFCKFLIE